MCAGHGTSQQQVLAHLELAAKLGGFQGCTLRREVAEVEEGGQL